MASDEQVSAVVAFFESITPQSVALISQFYAGDAHFKDPFNEVRGVAAIEGIFAHMFQSVHEPRFVVTQRVLQGDECFLTWDFLFRFKRFDTQSTQCIRGASHLRFNAQGQIVLHRDYWDAAEELYEKLPVLGRLMRWLKRRATR